MSVMGVNMNYCRNAILKLCSTLSAPVVSRHIHRETSKRSETASLLYNIVISVNEQGQNIRHSGKRRKLGKERNWKTIGTARTDGKYQKRTKELRGEVSEAF